jgi:glycosyltransferase involved in cell wall biosynthesis
MAKRKRIGLNFVFNNESNSGIYNYILSVIRGFLLLPEDRRPELVLFYRENISLDPVKAIGYPHIAYYSLDSDRFTGLHPKRLINSIWFRLFGRRVFENFVPAGYVDYVFPVFPGEVQFDRIKNKIHWLVDFNAYYYPHHYQDNGEWFFQWHKQVARLPDTVVVSSYNSLEDFKKFYPANRNKAKVLRFTAMIPDGFEKLPVEELLARYKVGRPYFITPNQFWEHKNHINLLKAWKLLADKGYGFHLVLTGSLKVSRGLGFQYDALRAFVDENGLAGQVHFLGVIDRDHQLSLIKNAEAIIQPSLFEGWSTLVEESKAMKKHILLSDIPVHREQIEKNCFFFDPHSPEDIAAKIIDFTRLRPRWEEIDYATSMQKFATDLADIFD